MTNTPNEKIQIDKSLKRIEFAFRWLGLFLENSKRTATQNRIYKLRVLINFVSINTLFIASSAWCIKGITDEMEYTGVTQNALNNVFVFLFDLKSMSFLIYENSVNELITALKNFENEELDRETPDGIHKKIKNEIGFLTKVLKIHIFGITITTAYFLGQPAVATAINYFGNHEVKLTLPTLVVFPFDSYDIRFWPYAYLHQIHAVSVMSFQTMAGDGLFFIFCTYLRISFIMLGHDFEEIIEKSDGNSQLDTTTDKYKKKLASLVKRHQNILNAVNILEKIYSAANLGNFLAYSMVLCINGFNLTKYNSSTLAIVFVSFLFTALWQIFCICYFADMLMDQSMRISDAVYNCNWYLSKKSFVKSLQIVHQRAQRPCKITAYGYVDVNLLTLTMIVSTAWSYFSLLNAVYE